MARVGLFFPCEGASAGLDLDAGEGNLNGVVPRWPCLLNSGWATESWMDSRLGLDSDIGCGLARAVRTRLQEEALRLG